MCQSLKYSDYALEYMYHRINNVIGERFVGDCEVMKYVLGSEWANVPQKIKKQMFIIPMQVWGQILKVIDIKYVNYWAESVPLENPNHLNIVEQWETILDIPANVNNLFTYFINSPYFLANKSGYDWNKTNATFYLTSDVNVYIVESWTLYVKRRENDIRILRTTVNIIANRKDTSNIYLDEKTWELLGKKTSPSWMDKFKWEFGKHADKIIKWIAK